MKIFKYELGVLEKQILELPKDAKIIRVDSVNGKLFLWAMVDESLIEQITKRKIEMYKTGQLMDNKGESLTYLGFCGLIVGDELGLYVFERI